MLAIGLDFDVIPPILLDPAWNGATDEATNAARCALDSMLRIAPATEVPPVIVVACERSDPRHDTLSTSPSCEP